MVVEEIKSRKDLCSIRAVDKIFHALATPKVFHTLYLSWSLRALSHGRNIIRDLAPYVRRVFFNGWRAYLPGEYRSGKDQCVCECLCGGECENVCECPDSPGFTDDEHHIRQTFALIPSPLPYSGSSSTLVQRPLSTGIDSLVLKNLPPGFSDVYHKPEFSDLISQLSYLKIAIRARNYNSLENHLWGRTMEDAIFRPCNMSGNLTSLAIACKSTWFPRLPPFYALELPKLSYLSLTRFIFDERSGIDEFIIEHGETIRCLKLILCPLLIVREPASGDARTTWKEVFDPMAAALKHVVDLTLKTGATGYISDMTQAYVEKDEDGVEFMDPYELPANCVDDWSTLQNFREVVKERVGGHVDHDGDSEEEGE
ncbi:hypothetical protein EVG20_g11301 [Dentipellis fragilis]|uniref:F-box domain-containing protein n=1 Tax=Dentipellis fragilis TaxID=205917 RepID=A0A4Y9XL99_9AGAM|nr:hypothetical protein EVG20_g11301 [Dentipellis fragilis]